MKNATKTAYDFSFPSINTGETVKLSDYKGSIIMVVNTASMCGFTKQYKELQKLYDTYKDKKFVVIGVPSNDFGGQEPGTERTIKHFCEMTFGINFPMTAKVSVIGKNADPFYQWAPKQAGAFSAPKWNFHKYLIDREGNVVDWFASGTSPTSPKVIEAIDKVDR